MIKVEKKYLSFTELREKWRIKSDELHYLIQDGSIIPAIAWNGYVRNCHWEPNESGQSYLTITESEDKFKYRSWLYLRLPTATGNCDYKFSYGTKTPYAKYDDFLINIWFKLLDGFDDFSSASIGREYIEKNAVFMTDVISNTEAFEFGLLDPEEVSIVNNQTSLDTYNTDLLNLLNLAITQFFNPRHKKDAKKDEITEWIKMKGKELNLYVSDNVADSIFTIIKPNDHNPKIKRVEPLE